MSLVKRILRRIRYKLNVPTPRNAVFKSNLDVLIVCPSYPSTTGDYGGSFVRSRVEAYAKAGLSVAVCVVSENTLETKEETVAGIPIWRSGTASFEQVLKKSKTRLFVVHHPQPFLWGGIESQKKNRPVIAIFHGYECRPWRTLEHNYSEIERERLSEFLDARDSERRKLLSGIFSDPKVDCVFVSSFLKDTAQAFVGQSAAHSHIIHNSISETDFPYREKKASDRFSILWIRSFKSYNYSNDLARDAVLELSKRQDFDRYTIRIFGEGELFEVCTKPLQNFDNVEIYRGFLSRRQMRDAHCNAGIMLVPSRWESQGLTCGEAMSSGLVPVTTAVAALPEFMDELSAVLCPPENALTLAKGIETLAKNPDVFLKMSSEAAERAISQCGYDQTIGKEIELIRLRLV